MTRPKNRTYDLKERLEKLRQSGLGEQAMHPDAEKSLDPLPQRVQRMLNLVKQKPIKATDMTYLILYDIENNKVRTRVAKYLQKKGCIRIQKSVFMASTSSKKFNDIHQTLKEVQEFYENTDSILLVPVNTSDLRSMKIIGKEIHIQTLLDKPNTLFI